jgi:uncharacterized lipoprotein YmbA
MKLWLSVVAALGLASCSAGQATAPATSSGSFLAIPMSRLRPS